MRWTIAILTVPWRERLFDRLMDVLEPQLAYDDIELLIADSEGAIPEKRQWCLDNAEGEYFNFIDDDDLVPVDYVDRIYPLLDGVDYIGFKLQHYLNGIPSPPTYHGLHWQEWWDKKSDYRLLPTHLNPLRTSIARTASFMAPPALTPWTDAGEDLRWSMQLEGAAHTEHFIDDVMYFYYQNPEDSASLWI